MPLDQTLLAILACPSCKGELIYDAQNEVLICQFDRLAFPVRDQIPVLLETEAQRIAISSD